MICIRHKTLVWLILGVMVLALYSHNQGARAAAAISQAEHTSTILQHYITSEQYYRDELRDLEWELRNKLHEELCRRREDDEVISHDL